MVRKLFWACLVILCFASATMAENSAILFGAVLDGETPLVGATVTIVGEATYTSRSVTTNEDGVYTIDKLPRDEYIIRVFALPDGKFKPGVQNISLHAATKKEVNFPMERK